MILRLSDWLTAGHHDETILIGPKVDVVVEVVLHNHVTRTHVTFLRRHLRQQDQEQRLKNISINTDWLVVLANQMRA